MIYFYFLYYELSEHILWPLLNMTDLFHILFSAFYVWREISYVSANCKCIYPVCDLIFIFAYNSLCHVNITFTVKTANLLWFLGFPVVLEIYP